jgi:hypothetical protein
VGLGYEFDDLQIQQRTIILKRTLNTKDVMIYNELICFMRGSICGIVGNSDEYKAENVVAC